MPSLVDSSHKQIEIFRQMPQGIREDTLFEVERKHSTSGVRGMMF